MRKALFITTLTLVAILGATALAGAAGGTVNITASVPNVFTVGVAPTAVSFTITEASMVGNTAIAGSATPVLNVKSNKLFNTSQTCADFASTTVVPAETIPVDHMTYAVSGDATIAQTAFVNASTALVTGGGRGNKSYTNTYGLTVGLDHIADNYTTAVVYTAVQQ